MSSLNKVSICGSNAERSLVGSRQSSHRSGLNYNTVNSIASLQSSARSRTHLGSRRMSRSSQRSVDMILKRILVRKKIISKAISDMLSVHPNEIGYDSLQNIIQKFKLPLSKDESLMLFENAKVLDEKDSNTKYNTWSSNVNSTVTGKANTEEVSRSLSTSLLGKVGNLIEIFEKIQRRDAKKNNETYGFDYDKGFKTAIDLLGKLNIPFDEKIIRKIFSQDIIFKAEKKNYSGRSMNRHGNQMATAMMQRAIGNTRGSEQKNFDEMFSKLKKSLRHHWRELHRSVEVLAVSGKFDYIPLDLVTRLFDKHFLGVGASEINTLMAVRNKHLAKQGRKNSQISNQNGFGATLFAKIVSACIDRQWDNVMKALDALNMDKNIGSDKTQNIELEIASKLQTYNVHLNEKDVTHIISSPDVAAPLSMSINLNEFNDESNVHTRKSSDLQNKRLPPRGVKISNGRRMIQRRGKYIRSNRKNPFATQQKVKALWQEIQKQYRNMPGRADGCLDETQFVEVISKLGLRIPSHKLKTMFRQFDTRGTGQIFFNDFLSKYLGGEGKKGIVSNTNNNINNVATRKSTDIGIINRSQSVGSLKRPDNVPRLKLGLTRIQSETDLDFLEEWADDDEVMALCS
eukprot:g6506.t1